MIIILDKDHVLVSEGLFLGYVCTASPSWTMTVIPGLAGIYIGSQLPDIDNYNSKPNHLLRPISLIFAHFGHRGITHSLWGVGALALGFYYLSRWLSDFSWYLPHAYLGTTLMNFILIGCLMHIVEDAFSKAGVAWFFPLFPHTYRYIYFHNKSDKTRGKRHHCAGTYVRTNIHTKFRYHSTDYGKKGRAERCIRYTFWAIMAIEIIYLASTYPQG